MAFFRYTTTASLLVFATASSSSKRGLCAVPSEDHPEDKAIWATCAGSLTWYYNYMMEPSPEYKNTPNFEFVPMLWGAPADGYKGTPFLDSIRQQIKDGTNITHILGFNEPDGPGKYGGSDMSPELAAQEWKRQIEPLKEDGIKLGAPAITGSPAGTTWLREFFNHCNDSCNPDFMPVHFYGSFEGMASKIGEVSVAFPQLPIWITEWGYSNQSLYDTQVFFNQSLRMFDDWRMTPLSNVLWHSSNITRYSYFGAFRSDVSNVGPNSAMLTDKGELTDVGSWYLGGAATNNIPHNSGAMSLSKVLIKALVVFVVGLLMVW